MRIHSRTPAHAPIVELETTAEIRKSETNRTPEQASRWAKFIAASKRLITGSGGAATPQESSLTSALALLQTKNERADFDATLVPTTRTSEDFAAAFTIWEVVHEHCRRIGGNPALVLAALEGQPPLVVRDVNTHCLAATGMTLRELFRRMPEEPRRRALALLDASLGDQTTPMSAVVEKFETLVQHANIKESDLVTRFAPSTNNSVELLVGGEEAFPQILRAVDAATDSIHISYYIFSNDELGEQFVQKLIDAKQRGVDVRMSIDGVGSQLMVPGSGTRALLKRLKAAGVDVHYNHLANPWRQNEIANHPDHRKVVIIDGKVGFTGGMNVGDRYVDDYHDLMVRVSGDAVKQMQSDFLIHWLHVQGPIPGDPKELSRRFFPKIEQEVGSVKMKVTQAIPGESHEILDSYLTMIGEAKESINVENPYCTNPQVQDALIAAAKRGVKVNVILPGANDHAFLNIAARARYPEMLAAGINIYEYPGFNHGKVMVVDNKKINFGSSNLDDVALFHIYEMNFEIEDEAQARHFNERIFAVDIPKSRRMQVADISTGQKIVGNIVNLFNHYI